MSRFDWLLESPIAHRGFHDKNTGVIENTSSAFAKAMELGYAIETDLQFTGDGDVAVFHDATLDRLTKQKGPLTERTMPALRRVNFQETGDRMQSLGELLEQVQGKVPLVLEIKSQWGGEGPLERAVIKTLSSYDGPAAVMSFSPKSVAILREHGADLPRGLVAERFRNAGHWPGLGYWRRLSMRHLCSLPVTKPDFIAYHVDALPAAAPLLAKHLFNLPLLAWTVRSAADLRRAGWADQIIFENFTAQLEFVP